MSYQKLLALKIGLAFITFVLSGCGAAAAPTAKPPAPTVLPSPVEEPDTLPVTPLPSPESQPKPTPFATPASSATEEAIPTDEWAVQLIPGANPDEVATAYGAENLGQVGTLPNVYLFRRPNYQPDKTTPDPLAADPRVIWLEQQLARQQSPRPP